MWLLLLLLLHTPNRFANRFANRFPNRFANQFVQNAPYHHARGFKSFSAMSNKTELIKEMIRVGVCKLTLPVKPGWEGRDQPKEIDLRDKVQTEQPNLPENDKKGHTSNEETRETHKYVYAETARKNNGIPTLPELKELCIAYIKQHNPALLDCDIQKFLRDNGNHEWLWTPAYCPWLQPM